MHMNDLKEDALAYLRLMASRFRDKTGSNELTIPLRNIRDCHAFADSVTPTIQEIHHRGPIIAPLVLHAMIAISRDLSNPRQLGKDPCSRVFAYEIVDRLHTEIPPTEHFADEMVGRILAETGSLDEAKLVESVGYYHARMRGATYAEPLHKMVIAQWGCHYGRHPELAHVMDRPFLSHKDAAMEFVKSSAQPTFVTKPPPPSYTLTG